jgi:hypothetical protein
VGGDDAYYQDGCAEEPGLFDALGCDILAIEMPNDAVLLAPNDLNVPILI